MTSAAAGNGAATPSPAVELSGVTKRFDDVVAVDRLDLTVTDGEFFSLLGASGCGKTTTLRMIAGLEHPTSGTIRVHGEDMGLRPPNKRAINTVFQSYALFPHMTVEDNVAFGLVMSKVPKRDLRERVADVIALVQLEGMEQRKPKQLSGGQQQRVALARALVNRPRVLLLDEPLGALDLKLRQAMQLELKELQERVGITFIYVTHDQDEALTMSDRIGVMHGGRLVQVGTPEEVYEHPATTMVAGFIGETNFIPVTAVSGDLLLADGRRVQGQVRKTPAGDQVLTVRPERLTVHAADQPCGVADNRLRGAVRRRVYQGNTVLYEIDLGPVEVRARHENRPGVASLRAGDAVCVEWDAAAATALAVD